MLVVTILLSQHNSHLITFRFCVFTGLDGGLVGLVMTSAIGLSGLFQWAVRQSAEAENQVHLHIKISFLRDFVSVKTFFMFIFHPCTKFPGIYFFRPQINLEDAYCCHVAPPSVRLSVCLPLLAL